MRLKNYENRQIHEIAIRNKIVHITVEMGVQSIAFDVHAAFQIVTHLIDAMDSNERATFLSLLPDLDGPINSTRETRSTQDRAQAATNRLAGANEAAIIAANQTETNRLAKSLNEMAIMNSGHNESFFDQSQPWVQGLSGNQRKLLRFWRDMSVMGINPQDVVTQKTLESMAEIMAVFMNYREPLIAVDSSVEIPTISDVSKAADARVPEVDIESIELIKKHQAIVRNTNWSKHGLEAAKAWFESIDAGNSPAHWRNKQLYNKAIEMLASFDSLVLRMAVEQYKLGLLKPSVERRP